jgi:hypothetical protein
MNKSQQKRFDILYQQHVKTLRRQGKAKATIDARCGALPSISIVAPIGLRPRT